jgi:hypothetical protein
MKTIRDVLFTAVILLAGSYLFWRHNPREVVRTEISCDTVTVRDTVFYEKPVETVRYIVRTDTVMLAAAADTVRVLVEVPIEQKEYKTDDYRAVIEGFRANLLSMEVYPETHLITKTEIQTVTERNRLSFGVQAGYGVTRIGLSPYVGVGVQWNLTIKN